MNNKKISTVFASLAFVLALQGCASTVLKPVAESNRDVAGSFNGSYQGIVTNTALVQQAQGNWQFNCHDITGKNVGVISVVDGIATLGEEEGTPTAFVSKNGKFRFEIPLQEVAAAAGTSDATISNGNITIILYGSLDKGAGSMTYGIAEFANNGCTSKVEYKKI